jgi:hypothetical protein
VFGDLIFVGCSGRKVVNYGSLYFADNVRTLQLIHHPVEYLIASDGEFAISGGKWASRACAVEGNPGFRLGEFHRAPKYSEMLSGTVGLGMGEGYLDGIQGRIQSQSA